MRATLCLSLVAFGQLCAVAMAQDQPVPVISPSSGGSATYITHVTVIDTQNGKKIQDRTVVISGDRISEVRETKGMMPLAGAKVVDGTAKYLIPGFWDMHVHTWDDKSTYPLYIANGVTGVRDMFGPPDANEFRRQLAATTVFAPHFYLASPIIDGNPARWHNSIAVTTEDEARRVVDDQKEKGADFIKVYDRLSRDAYFAIIEESRRLNISVLGHVPFAVSAWEAAAAKQKSFEHLNGVPVACSSREADLWPKVIAGKSFKERNPILLEALQSYSEDKCKRLFEDMKMNGVWAVPTLTVARASALRNDSHFTNDGRLRYFSGGYRDWLEGKPDTRRKDFTAADYEVERELFSGKKKLVAAMFRSGVPLLAGTDAGNPYCFPGFSLHDELALLVESGVTPLAALQAATLNAAAFMNSSDRYGTIAPGKIADLVLLDADPLADIHNTTKISAVFLAGKEFDRPALDQMLKSAEAPAKSAAVN